MTGNNASLDDHLDHRPNRRRWVGAFAIVVCLATGDRHGRSDDGDDIPGPFVINTIEMKLAWIPAGEFVMGSPAGEEGHEKDETRHRVRITRPFDLGVRKVTQKEWVAVMGTKPWKGENHVTEGDRYPAMYVSWEMATEFCRKLTKKERLAGQLTQGESYRLPTEAEWEYACRAGSEKRYYFGDEEDLLGAYAWYDANAKDLGQEYAHEVGRKRPNAWGLFDMHGNVWDWCSDWYGKEYYGESPLADPQGPRKGTRRVRRGGGWYRSASFCRSANRDFNRASSQRYGIGFRVVRTIAPSE